MRFVTGDGARSITFIGSREGWWQSLKIAYDCFYLLEGASAKTTSLINSGKKTGSKHLLRISRIHCLDAVRGRKLILASTRRAPHQNWRGFDVPKNNRKVYRRWRCRVCLSSTLLDRNRR